MKEAVNGHLASLIQKIYSDQRSIPNIRKNLTSIANFELFNLDFSTSAKDKNENTLLTNMWTSICTQARIQKGIQTEADDSQAIDPQPKRIIAFCPEDFRDAEILESLKIAFLKHHDSDEKCLISCSEEEIITFGTQCKTLVLIGHGMHYREGDTNPRKDKPALTEVEAQTLNKSTRVKLGPYADTPEILTKQISELLKQLPSVTHCRLTICMGGVVSKEFDTPEVFYKQRPTAQTGRESASVVFDHTSPEKTMVFDKESLAGQIWTHLFIRANPIFTLAEKDFALTASAQIIDPIPASKTSADGHFEGAAPQKEVSRWKNKTFIPTVPQFWQPEQSRLSKTKSITLATPHSSKHLKRSEGSQTESGEYNPHTYTVQ